jgi:hypothetical protein
MPLSRTTHRTGCTQTSNDFTSSSWGRDALHSGDDGVVVILALLSRGILLAALRGEHPISTAERTAYGRLVPMKITKLLLCCALPALFGPSLLLAQTKQVTVNATVAEMMNLTVDVTSVTFAFAAADYDATTGLATKESLKATTFSVNANRAWKISARAGNATFTFTPTGTATDPMKPSSTLAIRTGTATYAPFAGITEMTVATGSRGGFGKAGNVVPVDYQMKSDLAIDPPGSYALTLTFTLVAS